MLFKKMNLILTVFQFFKKVKLFNKNIEKKKAIFRVFNENICHKKQYKQVLKYFVDIRNG